ncbi:MAG: DEAD/DEAH box helicase [Ornithinimicrobium sp.]
MRSTQRRPSGRDRAAAELTRPERSTPSPPRVQAVPVDADNAFAGLGLHPDLVAALAWAGIVSPFPIQQATIPDALAGRDLLGRGQTGSGKTMAFGLPMLDRLAKVGRAKPHRPHAVILTPTRELAMQIVDALSPLMSAVSVRHQLIAGGMSYTPQLRSLDDGVEVLVATPGRLFDLIERGAADLSDVKITVLDEADHMAEMGFVEAITEILDLTPTGGQRMLFSATLDHGVDKVAKKYLSDPVTHSTDDAQASVATMEHHLFLVHPHEKKDITAAIANRQGRTVVFVRTKLGADRIATQLRESGVFAAALHGGLNQAQRTRVLEGFKSGQLPVLVATDVAARGIHVDDISLVLQADPPADHKDYLHRSGRTARAGRDGVVVTLALPHQRRQVLRLLDAAGAQTKAVSVSAGDDSVVATAGGRTPSGESIPQSQLDALLRPRRRGSSGGRGRGYAGGRGGQRDGGRRRQGDAGRGGHRDGGRSHRGAGGRSGQADRRQDRSR